MRAAPQVSHRGTALTEAGRTDDEQGAAAAHFAKPPGVQNVYVVHAGSVYARGIAGVFNSTAPIAGLTVVGGARGHGRGQAIITCLQNGSARPTLTWCTTLGLTAITLQSCGRIYALDPKVVFMGADGIAENSFTTATRSESYRLAPEN